MTTSTRYNDQIPTDPNTTPLTPLTLLTLTAVLPPDHAQTLPLLPLTLQLLPDGRRRSPAPPPPARPPYPLRRPGLPNLRDHPRRWKDTMATVEITSFGYLHNEPPTAHLTLDLRHHFRDPHVSPELRYMTANDEPVRTAVLNTPGITALVAATAAAVGAFAAGPSAGIITVADGCQGGRHRAPTFAQALADQLQAAGHHVTVHHRDLDRPVVRR